MRFLPSSRVSETYEHNRTKPMQKGTNDAHKTNSYQGAPHYRLSCRRGRHPNRTSVGALGHPPLRQKTFTVPLLDYVDIMGVGGGSQQGVTPEWPERQSGCDVPSMPFGGYPLLATRVNAGLTEVYSHLFMCLRITSRKCSNHVAFTRCFGDWFFRITNATHKCNKVAAFTRCNARGTV